MLVVLALLSLFSTARCWYCPHLLCEYSETCCPTTRMHEWGCCPYKNAVCCPDEIRCCPRGTVCDSDGIRCNPVAVEEQSSEIQNFKLQEYVRRDQFVECPDGGFCMANTTCCESTYPGYYLCCPFEKGVCCPNKITCCREPDYCDENSKCRRPYIWTPKKVNFGSEEKPDLMSEEDMTSVSEDVTSVSEDVTSVSEDVTSVSEDVTLSSEDVTLSSEDVTLSSEDVTLSSEDVTYDLDSSYKNLL